VTQTTQVSGFQELDKQLAKLKGPVALRVLKSAMLAASKPIEERARANLRRHSRSGALALSIGRRFAPDAKADKIGQRFVVTVGPIKGNRTAVALHNLAYRRNRRGVFYGHFLERGFQHTSGKAVPARPFLVPALRATQAQVINIFKSELQRKLLRLARAEKKRNR
jgi:HK97 gp10 family phage protein